MPKKIILMILVKAINEFPQNWLMDKRKISLIRDTTMCFKSYTHDVTTCVICGKNMNVCAHCYVKEISSNLDRIIPLTLQNSRSINNPVKTNLRDIENIVTKSLKTALNGSNGRI